MKTIRTVLLGTTLVLGGCAGLTNTVSVLTGASVTPAQAYIAANAFDAIETTAKTYLDLPACVTGGSAVCRSQSAVNVIVPAIRIGYQARKTLIATIVSNGSAPVSLYTALTAQTTTLQSIVTTYNIGTSK